MTHQQWGDLLRLAAIQFGIQPINFWKLSVWEWQQLTTAHRSDFAKRTDLENLINQFPDQTIKEPAYGEI